MKLNTLFLILVLLILSAAGLFTYLFVGEKDNELLFVAEGLIVVILFYLIYFYHRIIKPVYTIANGMDLLKEQDFSSRLGRVGQVETDRIVDVFNRIMEQLKNERLRLREQNHFLDLLIEASPMGVVVLNLNEQLQSLNPAARRFLNFPKEGDINGISSPLLDELRQIAAGTSQIIRVGDSNIYKCTHSFFMDRGFRHHFYLIEMLTEEVFKAEKKAYEKVIRMISHEVNNSTAGITSTLDTLTTTLGSEDGMQDVCALLQTAIERCYSMSRFITNFADVVRIPEPQRAPTSLNELVISCKRFMETICMNRQIEIRMELDDALPPVNIDRTLFEQVLVNIIKNSAESIGERGTICIHTQARPLSLEISDNGKGISRETEAKLFTPFFSTKPTGQGIGLVFIREVLVKHGCRFSLRTGEDGMTRFRVEFSNNL